MLVCFILNTAALKDFISCSVSCSIWCPCLAASRDFGAGNRAASREWRGRWESQGELAFVCGWVSLFRYLCSLDLKGNRDTLPSVPKSTVWNLPRLGTPLFSCLWNVESLEFAGTCCLDVFPREALLWQPSSCVPYISPCSMIERTKAVVNGCNGQKTSPLWTFLFILTTSTDIGNKELKLSTSISLCSGIDWSCAHVKTPREICKAWKFEKF